jgi:hypothetical protein
MAQIDYIAVIADLEDRKEQIDAVIRGLRAILATSTTAQPRLPLEPAPTFTSTMPRNAPRKGFFGRDPSEPTIADRAAAVMPSNGAPVPLAAIRERIEEGGRHVSAGVLRDILTRKDRNTGRFRKHGRGMFGLNPHYSENNGHHP